MRPKSHRNWDPWLWSVCLPCMATVALFAMVINCLVIPAFESSNIDHKKELIRRLTESVVSGIAHYHEAEVAGVMTREAAQQAAMEHLRHVTYGPEMNDYFWIHDMQARMLMHPVRPDLEGRDMSGYADANGRRMGVEAAEIVRRSGQGYLQYMWESKDDASRIVSKLSYVKGFAPWGWVVGTGVYIDDVRTEIAALKRTLTIWSAVALVIGSVLSLIVVVQGRRSDRRRQTAESALRDANRWLQGIVDSSPLAVFALDRDARVVLWSPAAECLLGWRAEEVVGRTTALLTLEHSGEPDEVLSAVLAGETRTGQEVRRRRKDGVEIDLDLSAAALRDEGGQISGAIIVVADATERIRTAAEREADRRAIERQHAAVVRLATDEAVIDGEFDRAVRVITEVAATTLEVDRAGVWLLNEDCTELRCVDRYDSAVDTHTAGDVLTADEYPEYFAALRAGRVIDARDAWVDPRTREYLDTYLKPNDVRALLDGTIRLTGEVIGVLSHEQVGEQRTWRAGEMTFAAEAAEQVAQALTNRSRRRAEADLKLGFAELAEANRRLEVLVGNMSGRELRMVELKQEVNELLSEHGRPAKYRAPSEAAAHLNAIAEAPSGA